MLKFNQRHILQVQRGFTSGGGKIGEDVHLYYFSTHMTLATSTEKICHVLIFPIKINLNSMQPKYKCKFSLLFNNNYKKYFFIKWASFRNTSYLSQTYSTFTSVFTFIFLHLNVFCTHMYYIYVLHM